MLQKYGWWFMSTKRRRMRRRNRMKRRIIRIGLFSALFIVIFGVASKIFTGKDQSAGIEEATETELIEVVEASAKYVVCLDAGHGFDDVGCESNWLDGTESEVTLAMVEILQEHLESESVEVILTHDGESFPSAQTIIEMAQEKNIKYLEEEIIDNHIFSAYERAIYTLILNEETPIDLFLSLHINSLDEYPDISQYELYYYEENLFASRLKTFCSVLSMELDNKTKIFATELDDSFVVTKYGTFPSVLIEAGYASNKNDAGNLNSEEWRQKFCEILSTEILTWLES